MSLFPARFEEFAGNRETIQRLSRAARDKNLPHAILLEGAGGLGKRTLARLIAQAAVCTAEEKPCGVCGPCSKVIAGAHPDIVTVQGGTSARSLHIDAIRKIRSDAYIRPNEAEYKGYLIFQAESMTREAQNALLKVLEEPPEHVLFVLTCLSASSMLPTVRSRAQVVTLQPVSMEEACKALARLRPEIKHEQAAAAAERSGGNIGEALRLLDGVPDAGQLAEEIALALMQKGELALLRVTAPLIRKKEPMLQVLDRLEQIFRDACVLRAGGTVQLTESRAATELSSFLTRDRLQSLIPVVQDTRQALEGNAEGTLLVTAFCARLSAVAGK